MHAPRPHGTFGAIDEGDAAEAELLMRRLTNFKSLSNLDSMRISRTLPSGAVVIAMDMGGVQKVIIQRPPQESPAPVSDGLTHGYIPMLFSGCIDRGLVQRADAVKVKFSNSTRKRLAKYDPEALAAFPKEMKLKRFMVELSERFSELKPKQASPEMLFTQYANLRPTWFSGAMAEVVQIVGGYGSLKFADLPRNSIEQAQYRLPDKVYKEIK